MSFKLSVYADDLIVVNSQQDIDILTETVKDFSFFSSARVNWGKSEDLMAGGELGGRLGLPGGLQWKKCGLEYFVFLGDEINTNKKWDNVLEQVKGRLEKWRWPLPKMSYRG